MGDRDNLQDKPEKCHLGQVTKESFSSGQVVGNMNPGCVWRKIKLVAMVFLLKTQNHSLIIAKQKTPHEGGLIFKTLAHTP